MLKIIVPLILTVSLNCLAQHPQDKSSSLTQPRERPSRITRKYNTFHSEEERYDNPTSYPATSSVETPRPAPKLRRRPKKTYYPKVISFYQNATPNNGYEFRYLTDDGVQRAERGFLSESGVWTVQGSVVSINEDNVAEVQTYIADGSGYKSTVRRYQPEAFRSLDDFLPWASEEANHAGDDNKLGDGLISSLLGGS